MFDSRKSGLAFAVYLSLALLAVHLGSTCGAAQIAADANHFPVALKAEAFLDRPTVVQVSFKVFFPKDKERYVPVSPQLAELLSVPPEIIAKPELRVRVKSTICIPTEIVAATVNNVGMLKGGLINCEIEIAPLASLRQGTYNVSLDFSAIDAVFTMIGSLETVPKATAQIQIELWPSPAAKQEALRVAEEERKRKEAAAAQARQAEEEAKAQARRQQEEAAAKARREMQIRWLKRYGPSLGLGLLLLAILWVKRKWLWPDFKASTMAGKNRMFDYALAGPRDQEPGMILHTAWASAWYGTRRRIKVETVVVDNAPVRPASKLSVLISVGRSVSPGLYLAILPGGAIRIRVSKDVV